MFYYFIHVYEGGLMKLLKMSKLFFSCLLSLALFSGCSHADILKKNESPFVLKIILGSTRQGRLSEKLGAAFKVIADKHTNLRVEIVDLRDYNLPFFNDETAPMMRTEIKDPVVQKWSDAIKEADAFIILVPEYNSGYPGVLKNALDSLYKEWNNKPVGFVGYSGGPTGGRSALTQLQQVTNTLKMKPVPTAITIPASYTLLSAQGVSLTPALEEQFSRMLDEITAFF